jgi:hypothetical protein
LTAILKIKKPGNDLLSGVLRQLKLPRFYRKLGYYCTPCRAAYAHPRRSTRRFLGHPLERQYHRRERARKLRLRNFRVQIGSFKNKKARQ